MFRLIGKFFVLILLSLVTLFNTALKVINFFLWRAAPLVSLLMFGFSIYLYCTTGLSTTGILFAVGSVLLIAISYILPFIIRKIDSLRNEMFAFIKSKKVKKDYDYYSRINDLRNSY